MTTPPDAPRDEDLPHDLERIPGPASREGEAAAQSETEALLEGQELAAVIGQGQRGEDASTHPRSRLGRHMLDVTPLRESKPFARLYFGNVVSGIGASLTLTAITLHVFDITHDTAAVAGIAVVALLPAIFAGLYGGMLADAFDRRRVSLIAASASWVATLGICAFAWAGLREVWMLYALATVHTVASTILQAARGAIVPRLLPGRLLPAAAALQGVAMGVTMMVGPAVAGVLIASIGYGWTYTIDLVLFFAGFFGVMSLPAIVPEGSAHRPGLQSLVEGWRFLRAAPNIRMTFVLDIVAMLLGFPRVILPAAGATLLGGGPVTVGVLLSSMALGGVIASSLSGSLTRIRHHGLGVRNAIMAYGASVVLFGVILLFARDLWPGRIDESVEGINWVALPLSCIAFAMFGAADNISAIYRTAILQQAAPDSMRGRLQGIFIVVVSGGPRLGDMAYGFAASLVMLAWPPLIGGALVIVLVWLIVQAHPSFKAYDAAHPTP